MRDRLFDIIYHSIYRKTNPYYTFMFSLLLFCWSIWILTPWGYTILNIYYPFWFALAGVLISISGFINAIKDKFVYGIYLMFSWWMLMAVNSGVTNWHTPGWILYGWIALMCGLGYLNRKFYKNGNGH